MGKSITEINVEHYNKAYANKSALLALVHSFISYDQQSKSKRNFRVIDSLLKEFKKTKTKVNFLDYGFGHGSLILKMPKWVSLFGCDISEEAVLKFNLMTKFLKRDIIVSTVEKLADSTSGIKFDLISCSHVIEHVQDDATLLKELKTILNQNGKLIINLPINEMWDDPKHARKYTRESALNLFSNSGLTVEKVIEADRMTGFFLVCEQVHPLRNILKIIFRIFRLLFAILPQSISELTEKLLSSRYQYQQLIIVASIHE